MPVNRPIRWSLAAPLLVLVGLFGMHGLGDHATAHATADPGTHAGTHPGDHAAMTSPVDAATFVPLSGGDPAGAAMGLCVAILLGGLVAWLVLAAAARRRTPWTLPRQGLLAAPIPRGRAPDPPTPSLLSVYRC